MCKKNQKTCRIQVEGKSDLEQINFIWYFEKITEMKNLPPTPKECFELLTNMKVTIAPSALIGGKVPAGWGLMLLAQWQ